MSHALPTPWCLRVVGGALHGRSIVLTAGVHRLGSAGGCDILLPAGGVQPRHAELVAGEVALTIESLDGAVLRLNDAEVATGRRSLVAGDRLGLGALQIVLDRVDADGAFLAPPATVAPAGERAAAPPRPRAALLFLGGFLVSAGALWWTLGPAVARPSAAEHAAERVQRLLAGYPEVRLLHAGDGSLQLDGFVESAARLHSLEQALAPVDGGVTLRVQVVEALVEQARRFVADPAVAVHYGGQGRLVLSGAADGEVVRQKIARLGEDLHPSARVDDRIRYRPRPAEPGPGASSPWTHWQELLPARIVSITESADGLRHIQLANGQRYYEGAQLRSGALLERITPDELIVAPEPARAPP